MIIQQPLLLIEQAIMKSLMSNNKLINKNNYRFLQHRANDFMIFYIQNNSSIYHNNQLTLCMWKKSFAIFIFNCLLVITYGRVQTQVLHLQEQSLPPGIVLFIADNGKYMRRCHQCGDEVNIGADLDSVSVDGQDPLDPTTNWEIIEVGNQVAIKADTGKYIGRCFVCWLDSTETDSVFIHIQDVKQGSWALWTPEYTGNGKWAFKSDNGKYLARCNNCNKDFKIKDFVFVYVDDAKSNALAQWTIKTARVFPQGSIYFQSQKTKKFMKSCHRCAPTYIYSASINDPHPNRENMFISEKFGDKYAFKAICEYCQYNAENPYGLLMYIKKIQPKQGDYQSNLALWTPYYLGDDKWAFKGANNKFMQNCFECFKYRRLDFAFASGDKVTIDGTWKIIQK